MCIGMIENLHALTLSIINEMLLQSKNWLHSVHNKHTMHACNVYVQLLHVFVLAKTLLKINIDGIHLIIQAYVNVGKKGCFT